MDLNQIRYAFYVATHRSFSQAADRLFVTQPTLSQQVRKLEQDLGYPLFIRSTRNVSLTEGGELFIEKAKPLLEMYDAFEREMYAFRCSQELSLSIGVLPTFLDFDIPKHIEGFQKANDDISLSLEVCPSEELIKCLLNQKFDVIIAHIMSTQPEDFMNKIEFEILAADHVNVVASSKDPLFSHEVIRLEELNGKTLLMQQKRSAIERRVEVLLQKYEITPRKVRTCPSLRTMMGSVAMNQGVCFHSSGVGAEFVNASLRSIPLYPEVTMHVAVMYLKNAPNALAIRRFYQHITNEKN